MPKFGESAGTKQTFKPKKKYVFILLRAFFHLQNRASGFIGTALSETI